MERWERQGGKGGGERKRERASERARAREREREREREARIGGTSRHTNIYRNGELQGKEEVWER